MINLHFELNVRHSFNQDVEEIILADDIEPQILNGDSTILSERKAYITTDSITCSLLNNSGHNRSEYCQYYMMCNNF